MATAQQSPPAGQPVARMDRRQDVRLRLSALRGGPWILFWLLIVAILVLPILLFLLVAFSPRLFSQGPAWFTLEGFRGALTGTLLQGILNSLTVAICAGLIATLVGGTVAWAVLRTDLPGRRVWSGSMFALLLAPSYLIALGWERLLEPAGVLDLLGVPAAGLRQLFYGPVGVIVVLAIKGVPFAYLALAGALRGLGDEFESAARVHGGNARSAARIVAALIAPACWSAFAIVFAESVSDFGVAATLANDAHFPVATFTLYNAIDSFPVNFPVAAAVGWVLMALAGIALFAQSRALRGRSFRVLGGRTRPARRHQVTAGRRVLALAALIGVGVVGLGVPAFGAVSASLINGLGSLIGDHRWSLTNYGRVLSDPSLRQPLVFSAEMAVLTATFAALVGVVAARLLATRGTRITARLLDLLLLTAVALPGIVFAAGYIFTYNLPLTNHLGVHLYGTSALLLLGYLATSLPSTTRVLVGSVSQLQESMTEAARVHGSGPLRAWLSTVFPLLARPILAAWILTFAGTLLELPVSQLLYPPGNPPIAIGITKALANYDFGGGTAMEVLAILFALAVVGALSLIFRLVSPAGWRLTGGVR